MKRSRPSGPKTHLRSDFSKRPKAKVGKRARKPANETDTKFRAASVKVKAQDVASEGGRPGRSAGGDDAAIAAAAASEESLELISSRGKPLSLLIATLHHHSLAARLSSLGGIRDAASTGGGGGTSPAAVRANLSALIPSLGRCIVDSDGDVRSAGLDALREVAARVAQDGTVRGSPCVQGCGTGAAEAAAARHLSPFLPLLVAYVTAALNSLDKPIRYHGAKSVGALVRIFAVDFGGVVGGLKGDATNEIGKHAREMLPGFARILDDARTRSAVTTGAAAGGRKKGAAKGSAAAAGNVRSVTVLRSLLLLLRSGQAATEGIGEAEGGQISFAGSKDSDLTPSLLGPDLDFLRGGSATNALLTFRQDDSPPSRKWHENYRARSEIRHDHGRFPVSVQTELLTRLRDRLVEISQAGRPCRGGLGLPPALADELGLIVGSVRLLWVLYSRYAVIHNDEEEKDEIKRVRSIVSAIQSLLLQNLPVSSSIDGTSIDSINATLCCSLGEIGSVLVPTGSKASEKGAWVGAVFAHVLPRLDCVGESSDGGEAGTDMTLVRVVGQLLLGPYLGRDSKRRTELLAKFGEVFFDISASITSKGSLYSSPAGRSAAMLLSTLILKHLRTETSNATIDTKGYDDTAENAWSLLCQMAQTLTSYLHSWEDKFPDETGEVLATLMAVVRVHRVGEAIHSDGRVIEVHDSTEGKSDNRALAKFIRKDLVALFVRPRMRKKSTKVRKERSIFENLSPQLQRLVVGLVGMLQFPSEELLFTLGKCCAHMVLSTVKDVNDVLDYVGDVMHSIRRTVSMQSYISFVFRCSGLKKKKNGEQKEAFEEGQKGNCFSIAYQYAFSYDLSVERLCRLLVRSGGLKVLPMVTPLLLSWLVVADPFSGPLSVSSSPTMRAALAIFACFFVAEDDYCTAINLKPQLISTVADAICHTCALLPSPVAKQEDDVAVLQLRLLSPILCLLSKRPDILNSVLGRLRRGIDFVKNIESIIGSLMMMLKSPSLLPVLKQGETSDILEDLVLVVEEKVANGPLDRLGGMLRTEVQLSIGSQLGKTTK